MCRAEANALTYLFVELREVGLGSILDRHGGGCFGGVERELGGFVNMLWMSTVGLYSVQQKCLVGEMGINGTGERLWDGCRVRHR